MAAAHDAGGVIVAYKVDRLTRSLADFAKLVELFDKHGVSFVSVISRHRLPRWSGTCCGDQVSSRVDLRQGDRHRPFPDGAGEAFHYAFTRKIVEASMLPAAN
jgi:hypothetical protein